MRKCLGILLVAISLSLSGYSFHLMEHRSPQELQNSSCLIHTTIGKGSATLFNRKIRINDTYKEYTNITFGITAYHCSAGGPIWVMDGEVGVPTKILYSSPDYDFVVFMLPVHQTVASRVKFRTEYTPLAIGDKVQAVGSPRGELGFNTYYTGYISFVDRVFNRKYDQLAITTYPGASGGGVFDNDGNFIGMITAVEETMASQVFMTTIRDIHSVLYHMDANWVIDESVSPPSLAELLKQAAK